MVKYTSSKIIEFAKQIADLTDSNFIRNSETLYYLNDAYTKIYLDCICHNDLYWIKEVFIDDLLVNNEFELPKDFYQLQTLSTYPDMRIIKKRNRSETINSFSYEIINNKLIIYNINTNNRILMRYYPQPETLTIKTDEIKTNINTSNNWTDCCKYIYCNSNFEVYNTRTNTIENCSAYFTEKINMPVVSDKYIVNQRTDGKICYQKLNTTFSGWIANAGIAKSNYELYYYKIEGDLCNIYSIENSNLIKAFPKYNIQPNSFIAFDEDVYYIKDTALYRNNEIIVPDAVNKFDENFYYRNGNVYTINNKLINTDTLIGFNQNKDGYGYTNKDGIIKSINPDTEINYPSNILYSVLAYNLAISFCIKQGKDPTLINAKYEDLMIDYYKTLDNDDNNYNRITNAYTGGLF